MTTTTKTTVSLIIPMLNEEANLPPLYESIRKQNLNADISIKDIIAVDNGSTDSSVSISEIYCTKIIVRPQYKIAQLRNAGADISSGDILIFIDADCILADDVVQNVVLMLKDKSVAAVGPDALIPLEGSTWVQKTWYLHTKQLSCCEIIKDVEILSSGFIAINRRCFKLVNGFNGELSIGEDTDISRKFIACGLRMLKSSNLTIFNTGHPRTIFHFIKREYWHGDSVFHIIKHKTIDKLTIYFILNALLIIFYTYILLIYRSIVVSTAILVVICIMPMIKAIIKVRKIGTDMIKLTILYVLYVCTRSAALLKIER